MPRFQLAAPSLLVLAALGLSACNSNKPEPEPSESVASAPAFSVPMASDDPAPGAPAQQDDAARPVMQAQVVLERLGFAPGIIDGKTGLSTTNAVSGFQKANGLPVTGKFDEATMKALSRWSNIAATRVVTIPDDFAAGRYEPLPKDPAQQAKLSEIGYTSLEEKLAERFHTTAEVLRGLNPAIARQAAAHAAAMQQRKAQNPPTANPLPPEPYRAGLQLRVPNTGGDRIDPSKVDNKGWLATLATLGVSNAQPEASRIVVSKSKGTLEAYDKADKLVAVFTVTTGSSHDPLPLGDWKINGTSYNPEFSYDASLFWDVPDSKGEHLLPPGPNGPVGVAWIDLSKEHYGIHGTPEPQTIGRAESHGCVRLTNWDAARLAQMVTGSTKVSFVS
ncbi:L,D-transpeptidase family protein [Novosphingobium jiangmenense]|uniref:Murein L,D-transpeptidase n=1 Tax=Novosphingobium jiangmenense TaxID=2791981 RepID=A0ABS0HCN1_9SPHN|nr:L,D-transpeptidase family protein [Novosphingobium jiangmenense]MBF9150029.1 murein L,D-transpeptidase [Novosphingobium jiangmenense]